MGQPLPKSLIQGYLAARARANRFMRDSSPPLSKKGLASLLKLEQSAFNKFLNGTIFADVAGNALTAPDLTVDQDVYLRPKWTERRLGRFVERVETDCWKLGIANQPNPTIKSAAKTEVERLRVSKHYQFLCDIKDSAEMGIPSALLLWEVGAQEAIDAREHLRPTMVVNALVALGDIVDRKQDGRLCCHRLRGTDQQPRLELAVHSVQSLIHAVHAITGDPCLEGVDSKKYECYHKAHGYGGYDLFFLGVVLDSESMSETGVRHLLQSIETEHHPNDGHVVNTSTVLEYALRSGYPRSEAWVRDFRAALDRRMLTRTTDPAVRRLVDMNVPMLRSSLGQSFFSHPLFQEGREQSSSRISTQPSRVNQSPAAP